MARNSSGREFEVQNCYAVCFDMDGVLVDLYAQDDWLERLNNLDSTPYMNASPLIDMSGLSRRLEELKELNVDVYVLSWCSGVTDEKYDRSVERAKRAWLEKHLPCIPPENIFVMRYGTPKWELLPEGVMTPILFDDTMSNCESWPFDTDVFIEKGKAQETIFGILDEMIEKRKRLYEPIDLIGTK